jgi:hypothetical protein
MRWIPVTERMPAKSDFRPNDPTKPPPDRTTVLVATTLGRVLETQYTGLGWANLRFGSEEVTHWMPKPEHPAAGAPVGPPWCCEKGEAQNAKVCPDCADAHGALGAQTHRLGEFVNAAHILASDKPYTVVQKLQATIDAARGVAPAGEPSWWAASLNRRATVEQWMFDAARGKRPMPTPDELRAWAIKLGTPADGEPAPGVTPTRGGQNRGA